MEKERDQVPLPEWITAQAVTGNGGGRLRYQKDCSHWQRNGMCRGYVPGAGTEGLSRSVAGLDQDRQNSLGPSSVW